MLARFASAVICCVLVTAVWGQEIEVRHDNKTIAVAASGTAEADAEIATLNIGFDNSGPSKDSVVAQNLKSAENITSEMSKAGVSKEGLETAEFTLSEERDKQGVSKQPVYRMHQLWRIRVPVSEAQRVLDIAFQAGANVFEGVTWDVADPTALERKARTTATARAQELADELAKGLGAKVGELLYVSDTAIDEYRFAASARGGGGGGGGRYWLRRARVEASPKLFPEKVSRTETVYAVFAIQ